ncbi:uncharacterized protein BXIN_2314 [Babesia sp. Xinjiang]|uniref:uncharacterized protein n=1 Tax=Babesia sp. Xinjiang TaxID=462227 RepID=UPI000A226B63|nr:uncharacterized protein BXIN_2314 [Babesia sp. Xinjiang]ORM40745.1 hypothetical protein BXIN_2314 [Babesia sp. Xinjiang]
MVYLVHLPVISFTLTGVPCSILIAVCVGSLVLGAAFHMVLISSLYAEYHGHAPLSYVNETFSWLRPDSARGFTIVLLDAYIVMVQVFIGILCYRRFEKLGHVIAAYRTHPAHFLGSFDSLNELEKDFLPPTNSSDAGTTSTHRKSPESVPRDSTSLASDSDVDVVWENFERENLKISSKRPSKERIEPCRFKKVRRPSSRLPVVEGGQENQDPNAGGPPLDEIRKHYKPRPGGYVESLLQSGSMSDHSKEPQWNENDRLAGATVDTGDAPHHTTRNVTWLHQPSTTLSGSSSPVRTRSRTRTHDPPARDHRAERHVETAFKHLYAPQNSKLAGSTLFEETAGRSHIYSALDTLRQVSFTSFGTLTSERVGSSLPLPTNKSWRESYDELRSMTRGMRSTHESSGSSKISEDDSQRKRIWSFEGSEHYRTDRTSREPSRTTDGSHSVFSPGNFGTAGCLSQSSFTTPDPTATQPIVSSPTMNAIMSVMPSWGHRLVLSGITVANRLSSARDMMNNYAWTNIPRMPSIGDLGLFVHTSFESWYVEWMHDFNVKFYTVTFKETLMIFILCVFSDTLVALRLYSTLTTDEELGNFFSWSRVLIMTLRYFVYPVSVFTSLWYMTVYSGKDHFFYFRSLLILFVFNICLTLVDLWSCVGLFKDGYALHNSLHVSNLLTTMSLTLFAREPALLVLYGLCVFGYSILLYFAGFTLGYSTLEIVTQMVVSTGCMVFCVRPMDMNRRKLFSLYTLPYLFYLQAMHS